MACKYGFTVGDMVKEGRVKVEDVDVIKDWLKDEKFPKYTDEMVVLFLMACDSDIEATKICAREYYLTRNDCPEVFTDRNLSNEDILKQWNVLDIIVFPERTSEGFAIILFRLNDRNPKVFNFATFMKLKLMTVDALLYKNPPKGVIYLYDMNGSSLRHITRLSLSLMRRLCRYAQDGQNAQLKKIHILNVTWFLDKLMALVYPFCKPHLMQMFHKPDMDLESFYQNCVPKRCLPSDYYGGDSDSVQVLKNQTWNLLQEFQETFKQQ